MTSKKPTDHEERLDKTREFWDNQACTFDNEPDHGLRDPEIREAWEILFRSWLPLPQLYVLDIGCGTGSLSLVLARLGHYVTGIDLSPAMISLAKAKAAAVATIEFSVMDASFPQFAPQTFDALVCRHLLWALSERDAILERWTRLLKPNGVLVFIEGFWHTGAGLRAQEILNALPSSLADVRVQNLSPQSVLWGREVTDERYAVIAKLGHKH